jgi:hypothetical protein
MASRTLADVSDVPEGMTCPLLSLARLPLFLTTLLTVWPSALV